MFRVRQAHFPQLPLFVRAPGRHCRGSGRVEAQRDLAEQRLVRIGGTHQEADAARVGHHRPDSEQREADWLATIKMRDRIVSSKMFP